MAPFPLPARPSQLSMLASTEGNGLFTNGTDDSHRGVTQRTLNGESRRGLLSGSHAEDSYWGVLREFTDQLLATQSMQRRHQMHLEGAAPLKFCVSGRAEWAPHLQYERGTGSGGGG